MTTLSRAVCLWLYENMVRQRALEDEILELYKRGIIRGLAHLCAGQEGVAAGVCGVLGSGDLVVSSHRGHGHSIAKGVPEEAILGELMGKKTGMCLGLGGSMHSSDLQAGIIFSTAIVGGGIPLSVGAALALKMNRKGNCVACFFGDGATNTGAFHEGINLAALWRLPVIFICENNQYAVSVPVSKSTSAPIAQRGQAYGIPGLLVDGMNVLDVYNAASEAVARAKDGNGPTLIECATYRYGGHGAYDSGLDYRTQEEIDQWIQRDPIKQLKQKLIVESLVTPEELETIQLKVKTKLEEAVRRANESSCLNSDSLRDFVWA